MSTWRTHYEPSPLERRANAFATMQAAMDRRARRRSRVILAIVLAVVLGPLALALVLHLAMAIGGTSPAPDRSCAQPVLLRATDTL